MCMRRELMQNIRFDETFNDFHDYDISIQSIVAGYTNYTIYDIKI